VVGGRSVRIRRLNRRRAVRITAIVILGVALPAVRASSQPQALVVCTYRRCALGIAPTWNGLAVVRGVDGQRVANLNFFWPHDISERFAASSDVRFVVGSAAALSASAGPAADSAVWHARRAVHLRRFAAVLTDAGLLLGGYVVARAAANSGLNNADRALGIAGASAFAVGVPLQFAADGALSRAVWWYDARFAP